MEIVSRKEAFERGLTRYFTGNACPHGHIAQRCRDNGECVKCALSRSRTSDKNKYLQTARKWKEKNPDKVRRYYTRSKNARMASTKKWRERSQDKIKAWRREYWLKIVSDPDLYQKFKEKRKKHKKSSITIEKERERARNWARKERAFGPKNPTGKSQWLRKNQAQLRTVKRLLSQRFGKSMKPVQEQSRLQSAAFTLAQTSPS